MSVLSTLSKGTLMMCRQIVRRTHSEYFHGQVPPDWVVDQLIESLGEETIRKMMDNANLAGIKQTSLGAVRNDTTPGGRLMRKLSLSSSISDAIRSRDPDHGPSAEVPGRNPIGSD